MTVTISVKADEPVTQVGPAGRICIFCVSGSDSSLQNAIDDFREAVAGR